MSARTRPQLIASISTLAALHHTTKRAATQPDKTRQHTAAASVNVQEIHPRCLSQCLAVPRAVLLQAQNMRDPHIVAAAEAVGAVEDPRVRLTRHHHLHTRCTCARLTTQIRGDGIVLPHLRLIDLFTSRLSFLKTAEKFSRRTVYHMPCGTLG